MRSVRFKKIDAFTGPGSPGNPAGCVYPENAGDIIDGDMLRIARELKGFVSEVACVQRAGGRYCLRYYASEGEVCFCGHATLAAMYDLFTEGELAGRERADIRAGGEELTVRFSAEDGSLYVTAPSAAFPQAAIREDELARALYIEHAALDRRIAPAAVRCGLTALLVPMRTAGVLTDVKPGMEPLTGFCVRHNLDIVVLFTDDSIRPGSSYRTRVFAPRFGYMEDPATGSGNAALGHWLLSTGRWDGGPITIEQGVSYRYPNIVRLMAQTGGAGPAVLFGGRATVRIDGRYNLP